VEDCKNNNLPKEVSYINNNSPEPVERYTQVASERGYKETHQIK